MRRKFGLLESKQFDHPENIIGACYIESNEVIFEKPYFLEESSKVSFEIISL